MVIDRPEQHEYVGNLTLQLNLNDYLCYMLQRASACFIQPVVVSSLSGVHTVVLQPIVSNKEKAISKSWLTRQQSLGGAKCPLYVQNLDTTVTTTQPNQGLT